MVTFGKYPGFLPLKFGIFLGMSIIPHKIVVPGIIIAALVVAAFGQVVSQSVPRAEAGAEFNASMLVTDGTFASKDSMSVGDIQRFLEQKGSVLAQLSSSELGEGANGRSAAQIIWEASRSNISDFGVAARPSNPFPVSVNPHVILVTLQKEQSLILNTSYQPGSENTRRALKAAMGMGCPDSGGCSDSWYGFYNQVIYGTAQLYLHFWRAQNGITNTNPARQIGDTINFNAVLPSVCNDPRFSNVTIANAATAAFYRYTTGCNGNYNVWFYMNKWFTPSAFSPQALVRNPESGAIYVVYNSVRYPIDSMETFRALGFSESSVTVWNQNEAWMSEGPLVKRLLLAPDGSISYLINGRRHPIASPRTFELRFRWQDISARIPFADQIPYSLPYYELAKMPGVDAIYIMTNGRGYSFPDPETYANDWGFKWDDFATTPSYTFDPYPLDGRVTKYVKGSGPAVFIMDGGRRLPVQSADAYNHWKFDWSGINTFDDRFLSEFQQGPLLTRLAKGSGSAVYYIENGTKRPIASAAAFTKNKFNWSDVTQVSDRLLNTLPTGSSIR